jgi:hypothetical protein
MDEDARMNENVEETLARLVAGLGPESYERYAPGLQELGLALAERREALREMDHLQEVCERMLEGFDLAKEGYDRAKEDLERADERTRNALQLIEDAM